MDHLKILKEGKMNSVGIDVSKGKSVIAIMRPGGEVVKAPFECKHTTRELEQLKEELSKLEGETKIVMEYTSNYYQQIAKYLHDGQMFVSVVHALRIHYYGNDSIRRIKTDKADAIKIANYGLDHWNSLLEYNSESEIRQQLKQLNRQYYEYMKIRIELANNLTSLLDQTFPNEKKMFSQGARADGHEKWVDFACRFWHSECVTKYSLRKFQQIYLKWCKKHHYNYDEKKAICIYETARDEYPTFPCNELTQNLIVAAIKQVNCISETLAELRFQMNTLAQKLPEYSTVLALDGVGKVLAPKLIAEIGDIRRFPKKECLVAFAGVDAPPFQSGTYESHSRRISKKGSPYLRKTLFEVMMCLMQHRSTGTPVFDFMMNEYAARGCAARPHELRRQAARIARRDRCH